MSSQVLDRKAALNYYLFHDDPEMQAYGRLLATEAFTTLGQWMEEEQRRGSTPTDVLVALTMMAAHFLGSVTVASRHDQSGMDSVVDLFRNMYFGQTKGMAETFREGNSA